MAFCLFNCVRSCHIIYMFEETTAENQLNWQYEESESESERASGIRSTTRCFGCNLYSYQTQFKASNDRAYYKKKMWIIILLKWATTEKNVCCFTINATQRNPVIDMLHTYFTLATTIKSWIELKSNVITSGANYTYFA